MLLTVATTAALLAGCGGDPAKDEGAVKEAAQEEADRYASGDIAGSWDLWASDAQAEIPKDLYVAYIEECYTTGLPLEVQDVRIDETGKATVRVGVGDLAQSYEMVYEDDEWRWVPTDDTMTALADISDESQITC